MIAAGDQATAVTYSGLARDLPDGEHRRGDVRDREAQVRTAFVMEQTLGHVTHFRNLQEAVASHGQIAPTWLPILFEMVGPSRLLPLFRSNWSVRASLRARRALGRALSARRHDALVFHTQVTTLFSVNVMRRVPSVISLDATPLNYDIVGASYGHRAAGSGPLDRQKHRMNKEAFHAAAALVTWSEWARGSLIDDYEVDPARIDVLAPGAAAGYFAIGESRLASSVGCSDDTRKVQLLFVGSDFDRKGGPLLLECMQGELAERCDLHLVTSAAVEERPGVRVHHGVGPNSPELFRLFADADLFVLPSMGECLAVVLMEATAAALPIITTNVGALSEAVIPGESGLLVRPGDASDLRQALESLVASAELRRRLGRAGQVLAREKFDSHKNNRALLDLVIEVAQHAAQTGSAR